MPPPPAEMKRSLDCPVMRKIDALPGAVIEITPHIRNVAAWITLGPGKAARWILDERVSRRKDVGFEHGMTGWPSFSAVSVNSAGLSLLARNSGRTS